MLHGDGIGPEVVEQAIRVTRAAVRLNGGPDLTLNVLPAGLDAYQRFGTVFPDETRLALAQNDGCLLGPLTTHVYGGPGMVNISRYLRKGLALYSNIRPVRSRPAVPSLHSGVDIVVVRENTEGFYADRNVLGGNGELRPDEDTVISTRVVTRKASAKVAEQAFRLARHRGRQRLVTAAHKANVLRRGCGLFLETCRAVGQSYPDVTFEDMHVDALAMKVVMQPQALDVIVATNLFGDILSDVCAGVVGGLGLAPGLNVGENYAVGQAVHGSALELAGRGVANPCAEILTMALLLDWLGAVKSVPAACEVAKGMEAAVERALESDRGHTPDLGGNATTLEVGDTVIASLRAG